MFSIRDRKVVLHVRRRRWLDENMILSHENLTSPGTSYSRESSPMSKKTTWMPSRFRHALWGDVISWVMVKDYSDSMRTLRFLIHCFAAWKKMYNFAANFSRHPEWKDGGRIVQSYSISTCAPHIMWYYEVVSYLFARAIVGANCFGTHLHTLNEQGFDQCLLPAQFH